MDQILEHLRGQSGYNAKGEEIPDPHPKELVVDVESSMSLEEKVMRALRSPEWNQKMRDTGRETFEEANDFDIPEEESEFKSMSEDEDGDVLAFEEGVRRGFVEEIPEEKRLEALKAVKEYRDKQKPKQTPKIEDKGA